MVVRDSQQVMLISVNGTATRTSVNGISRMGRNTQGVTVMRMRDGDRLSSVALVAEQPDELEDLGRRQRRGRCDRSVAGPSIAAEAGTRRRARARGRLAEDVAEDEYARSRGQPAQSARGGLPARWCSREAGTELEARQAP